MYSIEIKNQKVYAPIGWGEDERNNGVELLVSVKVWLDSHVNEDELNETINYVDLLKIVLLESQKELKLLETFSKNIALKVKSMKVTGLKKIEVEIRKPYLPVDGYNAEYASVLYTDEMK